MSETVTPDVVPEEIKPEPLEVTVLGQDGPGQEMEQRKAQALSIEELISQAVVNGTPVETMEKLLAMRRELKAEAAKEAFDDDMAKFQGDCPVITKTKSVATKTGKKAYSYAPLDVIVAQTKGPLRDHGFSYKIDTETLEGKVKVTCIVKHKAGHRDQTSVEVPLGTKTDIMSNTQVVAAALTFAKRYAYCNAFGILTGDEDDDAISTKDVETNGQGQRTPQNGTARPQAPRKVTQDQLDLLNEFIMNAGDPDGLANWILKQAEVKHFQYMTYDAADKIIAALRKKTAKKKDQDNQPPATPPAPEVVYASEVQKRKIFALGKELGLSPNDTKERAKTACKAESFNSITEKQADALIIGMNKKITKKALSPEEMEAAVDEIFDVEKPASDVEQMATGGEVITA